MSKITLSNISAFSSWTSAGSTIDSNSATVQTAFDNTLSRNGVAPNEMMAQLDMNSNQIINLPYPGTPQSPVRLEDVSLFVEPGPPGPTGATGATGATGPSGASGGNSSLSTIDEAMAAIVPNSQNYLKLEGWNFPGDGGAQSFQRSSRVGSIVRNGYGSIYSYAGNYFWGVPPNFVTGIPNLVFALTAASLPGGSNGNPAPGYQGGPTTLPIVAGCLAFIIASASGGPNWPSTLTGYAPNGDTITFTLGPFAAQPGTASFGTPPALYYCLNPLKRIPCGSFFDVTSPGLTNLSINVYTVPGFTNAAIDRTAFSTALGVSGTASLSTSLGLTANPSLAIGVFGIGNNAKAAIDSAAVITAPVGWSNITPGTVTNNTVLFGRQDTHCTVLNSNSIATYSPSVNTSVTAMMVLATFKTYPQTALNPAIWQAVPSWPYHTSMFGIGDGQTDWATYAGLGRYLNTITPRSNSTAAGNNFLTGSPDPLAGTCTISAATQAIVTVNFPYAQFVNSSNGGYRNGTRVRFSTTGTLPSPIQPNTDYFIKWGTVKSPLDATLPNSFQITGDALFTEGRCPSPAGASVNTLGSSQSGPHTITFYGDDWAELIWDPGLYYTDKTTYFPTGYGFKKLRVRAAGAHFKSNFSIGPPGGQDLNTSAPFYPYIFWTPFKTTNVSVGTGGINTIELITHSDAAKLQINGVCALVCNETQGYPTGPWNPHTFEFKKIYSADPSTGIVTFYENLRYNYIGTDDPSGGFPKFIDANAVTWGPATLLMLNDTFDMEFELHDALITSVAEIQTIGRRIKFVNCEMFGGLLSSTDWGIVPSMSESIIFENCKLHFTKTQVDKMTDYLAYINCSDDEGLYLFFGSSSTNLCLIDKCKMGVMIRGTPKNMIVRDSFINGQLSIGNVFGGTESLVIENSNVQAIAVYPPEQGNYLPFGTTGVAYGSDGIFRVAPTPTRGWTGNNRNDSANPLPGWSVPGAKAVVWTSVVCDGTASGLMAPKPQRYMHIVNAFNVGEVFVDGSNKFCVTTDLGPLMTSITFTASMPNTTTMNVTGVPTPSDAVLLQNMVITGGGLPAGTIISSSRGLPNGGFVGAYTLNNSGNFGSTTLTASTPFFISQHPCPKVTVTGTTTGGEWVATQAGAPAAIPLFSYFKKTYTGFPIGGGTQTGYIDVYGYLKTLTVNVTKPYIAGLFSPYQLNIHMICWRYTTAAGYYPVYIEQTIDLTKAGMRNILSSGTVTTGIAGSTDVLADVPYWIGGGCTLMLNIAGTDNTLTNMPRYTIRAETDHGIDGAAVNFFAPSGVIRKFADTVSGIDYVGHS